jgi:hypothetical protein
LNDGLVCEGLAKESTCSSGKKTLVDVGIKTPSEGIFSLIGMNGAGERLTDTAKIGTCRDRGSWSWLYLTGYQSQRAGRKILSVDGSRENGQSHNPQGSSEQRSYDQ